MVDELFDEVDRLPQVLAAARVQGVFLGVIDANGGFVPAFDFGSAVGKLVDEHAIDEVGAFELISGRFPAPARADEVMINPVAARARRWKVGDRVESIRMFRTSDFYDEGNVDPAKSEQLSLTIVGIAQRPDELVARDAAHPLIVTIWLLAAVLFLAAMMVSVQLIVRALDHHYDDVTELWALGASQRQITAAIALHATTVVVGIVLVALGLGYLGSAQTPIGALADIEVDQGLRLDVPVAFATASVVTVMLLLALVWWGWGAVARSHDRAKGSGAPAVPITGNRSVAVTGRIRSGLLSSVAARFTFGGMHRASSGSRSVVASAALGTGLFLAALAFGSTLDRVQHTPQAHGWNWDIAIINAFGAVPDDALHSILDLDAVGESTAFTTGTAVIDGRRTSALGLSLDGEVPLVLISGHLPRSSDEIVLGGTVLDDIDHSVGDAVEVLTPAGSRSMTIVGVVTFPAIGSSRFGSVSLGDGAATVASVIPSADPSGTYSGVFLRVAPGGARESKIEAVREAVRPLGCTDASCFLRDAQPPQLAGYDDLEAITVPLSAGLACLVALPFAYGVVTTIRRCRRDMAILRALGMTHGQLSVVVVLCAVGLASVSVVIGAGLGAAITTTGWRLFSDSLGIRWPVHLPARLALVPGGAILVAVAVRTPRSFECNSRHHRPGDSVGMQRS